MVSWKYSDAGTLVRLAIHTTLLLRLLLSFCLLVVLCCMTDRIRVSVVIAVVEK